MTTLTLQLNRPSFLYFLTATLLFGVLALARVGLAVNWTISMPRGLYVTMPIRPAALRRGDIAAVCIPNTAAAAVYRQRNYVGHSNRCPVGLAVEIKPLAAVPGDLVEIQADGVRVNGTLVAQSRVFDTDSNGRPISHLPVGWAHRLGPGEFFTLSTHVRRSLDSRYYGPVRSNDLVGGIAPLLTESLWGTP